MRVAECIATAGGAAGLAGKAGAVGGCLGVMLSPNWGLLTRLSRVHRLDGKHVVFGHVKEGMEVVKKIEALGSRSGKTSKKIVISDCGQLS